VADFKIGRVNAQVFQGAESIVTHGAVVRQTNFKGQDVISLLRVLRSEIDRAVTSDQVPGAIMAKIETAANTAESEAVTSEPSSGKLVATLSQLKNLAAGLASTAGIAEAADRIIQTFTGAS
jgi:hypothetical protein